MAGFTRRIGITNSFEAELWWLRDGLTMCSNLNISSLIVELDAKVVVDIFHNANYKNIIVSPILDECRHLMSKFDQVQVNHIYRQDNCCANALARMGAEQDISFLSLSCPPVDIRNSLDFDLSGLYSIRHGPELNLVL